MEKEKTKKMFRSRISVLVMIIILTMFIPVFISIFQLRIHQTTYILGGMFVFIVFLFTGMRYIISGDNLYYKIWFIPGGGIKISDIRSVERSYKQHLRTPSPAVSLKKLRINLGGKLGRGGNVKLPYILISPVREQEFIEELKAANPDILVSVPVKKGIWRIQDWDI